jgi:hypothetical protein
MMTYDTSLRGAGESSGGADKASGYSKLHFDDFFI